MARGLGKVKKYHGHVLNRMVLERRLKMAEELCRSNVLKGKKRAAEARIRLYKSAGATWAFDRFSHVQPHPDQPRGFLDEVLDD